MIKPYTGIRNITSEYGNRRFKLSDGSWYSDFHNGIDIGGVFDVLAAEAGTVVGTATNGIDRGGKLVTGTPANYVIIDHGGGVRTLYWHLGTVSVKNGQRVSRGQKIGVSGRTGVATGYHLHFMVQVNGANRNPRDFVNFNSDNNSNLPINNNSMEFVTVQSGWGLSHVAQAAGLPINTSSYEEIYRLNAGHRGSWDWQSLNARMGAGDQLRVRAANAAPAPKPTPAPVDNSAEVKKLKEEIEKIQKEKTESDAKAKEQYEKLVVKNAELEAVKQAEIAKLTTEKEAQKAKLESKLAEVNSELSELESSSIRLPENSEVADLATHLVVSEIKASGIKGKWHAFVDKTFQSDYVRSFLKYDWFYVVIVAIGFFATFSSQYQGDNELVLGAISVITGIGSQVAKYILTNYDKNKDGKIDINDLHIVETITESTTETR